MAYALAEILPWMATDPERIIQRTAKASPNNLQRLSTTSAKILQWIPIASPKIIQLSANGLAGKLSTVIQCFSKVIDGKVKTLAVILPWMVNASSKIRQRLPMFRQRFSNGKPIIRQRLSMEKSNL
jgi:hypothetical protein